MIDQFNRWSAPLLTGQSTNPAGKAAVRVHRPQTPQQKHEVQEKPVFLIKIRCYAFKKAHKG